MRHSYVTPKRPAFSPRCCPVVPTCVSARHIAKYARKTRCSNLNAGWAPDDADNIFNASNRVKGRRLRSQSSHRVRRRMRTGTPKTPLLLTKWCPSRLFPSVAGRRERHVRSFRRHLHQKSRHHPKAGFLQYGIPGRKERKSANSKFTNCLAEYPREKLPVEYGYGRTVP